MAVRPFTLLAGSAVAGVRQLVSDAAGLWADGWGLARTQLAVDALRAADAGAAPAGGIGWRHHVGEDGRALWLNWPADLGAEMQRALFAPDGAYAPPAAQPPQLAPQLAADAGDALRVALLVAMAGGTAWPQADDTPPPPVCYARGSGAVLVSLASGKLRVRCLLNEAAIQAIMRRLGPQPSALAKLPALHLHRVLAATPVTLTVQVCAMDLPLGSLLSAGAGDVIRLDASADAAISVTTGAGAVLFSAYLGQSEGSVAIEAARRP